MKFMFGLQHPLTCKPWTTLSNPCNKVRGIYFYKEVFLPASLSCVVYSCVCLWYCVVVMLNDDVDDYITEWSFYFRLNNCILRINSMAYNKLILVKHNFCWNDPNFYRAGRITITELEGSSPQSWKRITIRELEEFGLVLWYINHCRLFNVNQFFFLHINSSVNWITMSRKSGEHLRTT